MLRWTGYLLISEILPLTTISGYLLHSSRAPAMLKLILEVGYCQSGPSGLCLVHFSPE